jgi:hypothetical protein
MLRIWGVDYGAIRVSLICWEESDFLRVAIQRKANSEMANRLLENRRL